MEKKEVRSIKDEIYLFGKNSSLDSATPCMLGNSSTDWDEFLKAFPDGMLRKRQLVQSAFPTLMLRKQYLIYTKIEINAMKKGISTPLKLSGTYKPGISTQGLD
ncbi:MAG: hypothetical protein WBA93_11025 [Microcoleaceae cyanobacterium]